MDSLGHLRKALRYGADTQVCLSPSRAPPTDIVSKYATSRLTLGAPKAQATPRLSRPSSERRKRRGLPGPASSDARDASRLIDTTRPPPDLHWRTSIPCQCVFASASTCRSPQAACCLPPARKQCTDSSCAFASPLRPQRSKDENTREQRTTCFDRAPLPAPKNRPLNGFCRCRASGAIANALTERSNLWPRAIGLRAPSSRREPKPRSSPHARLADIDRHLERRATPLLLHAETRSTPLAAGGLKRRALPSVGLRVPKRPPRHMLSGSACGTPRFKESLADNLKSQPPCRHDEVVRSASTPPAALGDHNRYHHTGRDLSVFSELVRPLCERWEAPSCESSQTTACSHAAPRAPRPTSRRPRPPLCHASPQQDHARLRESRPAPRSHRVSSDALRVGRGSGCRSWAPASPPLAAEGSRRTWARSDGSETWGRLAACTAAAGTTQPLPNRAKHLVSGPMGLGLPTKATTNRTPDTSSSHNHNEKKPVVQNRERTCYPALYRHTYPTTYWLRLFVPYCMQPLEALL